MKIKVCRRCYHQLKKDNKCWYPGCALSGEKQVGIEVIKD